MKVDFSDDEKAKECEDYLTNEVLKKIVEDLLHYGCFYLSCKNINVKFSGVRCSYKCPLCDYCSVSKPNSEYERNSISKVCAKAWLYGQEEHKKEQNENKRVLCLFDKSDGAYRYMIYVDKKLVYTTQNKHDAECFMKKIDEKEK